MSRIFAGLLVTQFFRAPHLLERLLNKAGQAESLLDNGTYVEAAEALDQAITLLWDAIYFLSLTSSFDPPNPQSPGTSRSAASLTNCGP